MSLRPVVTGWLLLFCTWVALPAQAQYVYFRRPALRPVVVVRPAPRPVFYAPAPVVVAPYRPVLVPAPVVVAPYRPVIVRPRPVVVVRGRGYRRW